MRRILMLLGVAVVAVVVVVPSSAATAKFSAVIHLDFEGVAPSKPCPLDPTTTCDVGHIAGYGQVVQEFNLVDFVEIDGCSETTGDDLWTLVEDPASTFMTREVYTECTPGRSAYVAAQRPRLRQPVQGRRHVRDQRRNGGLRRRIRGRNALHAGRRRRVQPPLHGHDHDSVTRADRGGKPLTGTFAVCGFPTRCCLASTSDDVGERRYGHVKAETAMIGRSLLNTGVIQESCTIKDRSKELWASRPEVGLAEV